MVFERKKIIVSVDDFGIRKVADAILPLAKNRKVDRVSVLVRYLTPGSEDVKALLATGVKLDLHMELIDLIKSGESEYEGAIGRGINFVFRALCGKVSRKAVKKAWTSQIERFKEVFGKYPDGLNSHEHVHFFPQFFSVALELQKEFNIPFIRVAKHGVIRQKGVLVSSVLSWLWKRDGRILKEESDSAIVTSDYFISFDWITNEKDFFESLPDGVTEVVFHPERTMEYERIQQLF